jgi:hypothetical protein
MTDVVKTNTVGLGSPGDYVYIRDEVTGQLTAVPAGRVKFRDGSFTIDPPGDVAEVRAAGSVLEGTRQGNLEQCRDANTGAPFYVDHATGYAHEGSIPGNPLHVHMQHTFDECYAISVAKNADYASDADPLANFRACEQFGVPLTKGIMVRLSDKFARIGNLLDNEAQVKDEAIADTIRDAVNYLAILAYALETES